MQKNRREKQKNLHLIQYFIAFFELLQNDAAVDTNNICTSIDDTNNDDSKYLKQK